MRRTACFLLFVLAAGCGKNPQPFSSSDAAMTAFAAIGDPCNADTDDTSECGYAPQHACDTSLPGGYCKAACNSDADCPNGSVCVGSGQDAAGFGECMKTCAQDSDCRASEGYACAPAQKGAASHDFCDSMRGGMGHGGG